MITKNPEFFEGQNLNILLENIIDYLQLEK